MREKRGGEPVGRSTQINEQNHTQKIESPVIKWRTWSGKMALTSATCVTLETLGAGVVHAPADQSHGQPQEDQEDPVLPHLGHNVAPYSGETIWEKD